MSIHRRFLPALSIFKESHSASTSYFSLASSSTSEASSIALFWRNKLMFECDGVKFHPPVHVRMLV